MATAQQIITDIDTYMRQRGGLRREWYVGIAADARDRLFNGHNVTEKTDAWIFRQADSAAIARQVEKAYLDAGHDGGTGGGDASTDKVYAYRKSSGTDP